MKKSKQVTAFIKKYPPKVRKILAKARATIMKAAPKAEETISYGIPAYRMEKDLVYFAAFKEHLGFFPTSSGIRVFKKELAKYGTSKGTARFPLDKPIPFGLIAKITRFRVKEVLGGKKK